MSVHLLEEMSTPALDALDRARTVVLLTISPLETHGPHLPVGVDAFAARHFAETIAGRLVAARPGWSAVLAPTLHLGSFTFDSVGTVAVRQRVVRDALVDYGRAFARAGFRHETLIEWDHDACQTLRLNARDGAAHPGDWNVVEGDLAARV